MDWVGTRANIKLMFFSCIAGELQIYDHKSFNLWTILVLTLNRNVSMIASEGM